MRSFLAFTRKEITYQARSGKLMLLIILFTIIGIMNPAFAKLTPWLLEAMADSMAESGINITATTITALDSWTQFFKNAPIALIAFVLLEGSLFTTEYESGTLVLSLTKGLSRYKVVLSKALVLTIMWSLGYWLCFGITYGYTAYFWDNSIAQHLWLSIILWWIFGLWVISLMVLFSVLSKTSSMLSSSATTELYHIWNASIARYISSSAMGITGSSVTSQPNVTSISLNAFTLSSSLIHSGSYTSSRTLRYSI